MESFYKELLESIDECLKQNDYKQALEMVSSELAMPYIPREVETRLMEVYRMCSAQLRYDSAEKIRGQQSLEDLLMGSVEEAYMAVELLRQSNIRSHMVIIQDYLNKNPDVMIRSLLLEAMYDQGVTEPVHFVYEGMEIEVIPALIESIRESSGLQQAASYLQDWIENENPSLFQLAMECLIREAYLRLPLGIDEDESQGLALAIIEYTYRASNENFDVFIAENNVMDVVKLDLLLLKHDI